MNACLFTRVDRIAGARAHDLPRMRARLVWLLLIAVGLGWFSPAAALAQTSAADKAMAESLFDRGVGLMKKGQFAEACAQLEQSQTIERGIGTLLYLAECYEKLGRTASAWAMFREAASAARAEGQVDRAKTGTVRADKLEPQLSKLSIHVTAASAPPGLVVLRNGESVPAGVWGQSIPVDPGEQRVEASAPGYAAWSVTLQLPPNGALLTVDVPELTATAQPAPPLPAANAASESAAPAPAAALAAPAGQAAAPANTWQKPLGLVLGGAGVVALGLGSYFGLRAISKASDSEKACSSPLCDNRFNAYDSAQSAATLSTVFMISSAALLVGGAVVYFTGPSEEAPHLALRGTRGGAGIEFGGAL
jgi:tetratricopeptide (TPR) repeat protein